MKSQALIMILILFYSLQANLICNGDFQTLPSNQIYTSYQASYRTNMTYFKTYVAQDNNCWYLKNASTQKLEVKRIFNPPDNPTMVCDLIGITQAFPLCQTLVLETGKYYNLSFDLYANENINQNPTIVTQNNKQIYQISTGNNIYNVVTGFVVLIPNLPDIEICFTFKGSQSTNRGAYIDNVQLIKVLPLIYYQQVYISKIMLTQNSLYSQILIRTTYYPHEEIREELNKTIKLEIKNSPNLQVDFTLIYKNNTALQILVVGCAQYFDDIIVKFPQKIIHNFTQIYFTLYDEDNISRLTSVSTIMKWTQMIGKTFLCSYLIFSLMGIWNLLLLYNFLLIQNLPSFAFIALRNFSTVFYSENSIFEQVSVLKSFIQSLQSLKSSQDTMKLPAMIGQYSWFGSLGFQSNFFQNNAQKVILLVFLAIKLWIFSIINTALSKKLQIRKLTFRHQLHIFLIQIISSCPQTLIGSSPHLLKITFDRPLAKVSSSLSIVSIIMIAFIIFWDYLLIRLNEKSCKLTKQNKQNKPFIQKCSNQCLTTENLHFFLLHLTIPLLVVTKSDILFFVIVTPILLNRIRKFILNRKLVNGLIYFKLLALNIGWCLYHAVFLFFWLDTKFSFMQPYSQNQSYKFFVLFAGNYLIFFILFAATVEIADFLISLPSKYLKPLLKTCKLLFNVRNSQITPLQKAPQKKQQKKQQKNISDSKAVRKQREILTMLNKKKDKNVEQMKIHVHEPKQERSSDNTKLRVVKRSGQVKKTKQIYFKQTTDKEPSWIRHMNDLK